MPSFFREQKRTLKPGPASRELGIHHKMRLNPSFLIGKLSSVIIADPSVVHPHTPPENEKIEEKEEQYSRRSRCSFKNVLIYQSPTETLYCSIVYDCRQHAHHLSSLARTPFDVLHFFRTSLGTTTSFQTLSYQSLQQHSAFACIARVSNT